ncbi:hypothetical protein Tco_0528371 [Tanacetum coccineum]
MMKKKYDDKKHVKRDESIDGYQVSTEEEDDSEAGSDPLELVSTESKSFLLPSSWFGGVVVRRDVTAVDC